MNSVLIVGLALGMRHGTDPDHLAGIDAEVDLGMADGGHLIQARLNVSLPGIEHEVAQKIVDGAHLRCPFSKARTAMPMSSPRFEPNLLLRSHDVGARAIGA